MTERRKSLALGAAIIKLVTDYVEQDLDPEAPVEVMMALSSAAIWVLANVRPEDRQRLFDAYMALARDSRAKADEVSAMIDQKLRH